MRLRENVIKFGSYLRNKYLFTVIKQDGNKNYRVSHRTSVFIIDQEQTLPTEFILTSK